VIEWLRQRGRPFLFSSAMTAPDVGACLEAVNILAESDELVQRLWENARILRAGMQQLGFDTGHSQTPILPLMLGAAPLAQEFSRRLFAAGLFAMAIAYPTVPMGKARIRVMNSAAHTPQDLDTALGIFEQVGRELGVI
jgi:glycine C-acetyltransferase